MCIIILNISAYKELYFKKYDVYKLYILYIYNAKKIERKLHLDVTEQRAVCQ